MIGYQIRRVSVREYDVRQGLPGFEAPDEIVDVSGFALTRFKVTFEQRWVLRLFGRAVRSGAWRRIELTA